MGSLRQPTSRAAYLLALMGAPRVGAWTAVYAARAFPAPELLFGASDIELADKLAKRYVTPLSEIDPGDWDKLLTVAEAHIAKHEDAGIEVLAIDGVGYPPLMALAKNPAAILYCRGDRSALARLDAVAVVGTREPTDNGVVVARRLTRAMVEQGFTIVSGLAKGIDAVGHRETIDQGGTTIAVLGTSIDKAYPAAHRDLADEILSSGGALVSEYPLGMTTSGRHFVERDRLQAALSIAVMPIQTDVDGGTMHTVKFARESERAVVVPRPVESEADLRQYGGIRELIASGTVGIISSSDDYPRLAAFLHDYKDWLLAEGQGTRPTFDGMASTDRDGSVEGPDETLSFGL